MTNLTLEFPASLFPLSSSRVCPLPPPSSRFSLPAPKAAETVIDPAP